MSVKVEYDPVVDAAYIYFENEKAATTEHVSEGILLDYDKDGRLIGVEVLEAKSRLPEKLLLQSLP